MRQILAFIIAAIMLVVACSTPAILVPKSTAPAWAIKSCGANPVMCSDGGCCSWGHECSVDRFLPIYRDRPGEGHCTWVGE